MAGKKDDTGKAPVVNGFIRYFPRAILAVANVSRYGKEKYDVPYEEENWAQVEDGVNRYTDADGRHLVYEFIDGETDPESELQHAAHHAWNALARLERMLRDAEARALKPSHPEGKPGSTSFVVGLPDQLLRPRSGIGCVEKGLRTGGMDTYRGETTFKLATGGVPVGPAWPDSDVDEENL